MNECMKMILMIELKKIKSSIILLSTLSIRFMINEWEDEVEVDEKKMMIMIIGWELSSWERNIDISHILTLHGKRNQESSGKEQVSKRGIKKLEFQSDAHDENSEDSLIHSRVSFIILIIIMFIVIIIINIMKEAKWFELCKVKCNCFLKDTFLD